MSGRMPGDVKRRQQWAPDARTLALVGDPWVLVIVRDLASGPLRRSGLQALLPGVSNGALDERLKRMVMFGLVERRRTAAVPPRVDLELTERGRELLPVIAALVRWQLRSAWSGPRVTEWVDVGAWFRLAAVLHMPGDCPSGVLGLDVTGPRGRTLGSYTFTVEQGQALTRPGRAVDAAARISASRRGWVGALGPDADSNDLKIDGSGQVAGAFLDLFRATAS